MVAVGEHERAHFVDGRHLRIGDTPGVDHPLCEGACARRVAWRRIAGVVTHVFTHFPLELVVYAARLPQSAPAPDGMRWLAPQDIAGAALPSLMRKVLAHARVESPPQPRTLTPRRASRSQHTNHGA